MRKNSLVLTALPALLGLLWLVFAGTTLPACGDSEGMGGTGGMGGAGGNMDAAPKLDTLPKDLPLNEAGNYCTDPTGPGTVHDKDIAVTETWSAFDSPHIVKTTIKVGGDSAVATLNVDGCAVVKFEAGAGLEIGPSGKRGGLLAAASDNYHPIKFTGTAETPGHWKGIYFGTGDGKSDDSASSRLANVVIDYAGGPAGRAADAALFLEGTGKSKSSGFSIQLDADNLKVQHSGKYGLYTTKGARLKGTGRAGDFINNEGRPARVEADMAGDLPDGDFATGNKVPGIEVQGTDGVCSCSDLGTSNCPEGLCVRTSTNWRAKGTPYLIRGQIHVGISGSGLSKAATLFINPAAKFLMTADSGFEVGVDTQQKGALQIRGDALNLIEFKPDLPGAGAGHWNGIVFGAYADWEGDGSRIYYAIIDGAGKATRRALRMGSCGGKMIPAKQGAVIFDRFDPMNMFLPPFEPAKFEEIHNTTIRNCSGHAIVRAWDSDMDPPDFTAAKLANNLRGTDTMMMNPTVAGCQQTNPQKGGMCSDCTM